MYTMKIQLVLPQEKETHLIAPFFEEDTDLAFVMRHLQKKDIDLVQLFLKQEKQRDLWNTSFLFLPSKKRLVFIGKGRQEKWNHRKARLLVRCVVRAMKQHNIQDATIDARAIVENADQLQETLQLIGTEAIMAEYEFTHYKKKSKDSIQSLSVAVDKQFFTKEHKKALSDGVIIGEETNKTRTLSNIPGGEMTPAIFARHAKQEGKSAKLKTTILNKKQIEKLGMGGVLGVGKGSDEEPYFIILEHAPTKQKNNKPLVLVGKGVTFDTGGLNVKPGSSMNEMHMDMSGGAAVVHSLVAIARLNLPVRVIGLVPVVENMPSGKSYRPGDVLKSITGKTIEVLNTDAEGRVILADALGYAQKLKPTLVLDIATLTGAALVAVGTYANAFFVNEEKNARMLKDIGEKSGDYMWELPLWEEYEQDVKGTFGDVANMGKSKYGGTIAGAMFLKEFVSYPWVHIDMAPTMTTNSDEFLAKGAKGTGVRLFVEVAKNHQP